MDQIITMENQKNEKGGLLKDDSHELKLEPISLSNWTIKKS